MNTIAIQWTVAGIIFIGMGVFLVVTKDIFGERGAGEAMLPGKLRLRDGSPTDLALNLELTWN
ncbi:MAG: hypothetical protein FWF33_06755 [Clostridiales bacterium]|nr:hypothetical protein [Clostridiales bacterium]